MAHKYILSFSFSILLLVLGANAYSESAVELVSAGNIKGGLIVHLGCASGALTAKLRVNERYVVQGLDTDQENVNRARQHIHALGRYGPITVERFDGERLPYMDNLVNLLIVSSEPRRVSEAEIMRVLAPRGVALIKGRQMRKPWPPDIDEWTHFLHSPNNNAVAQDTRIEAPRYTQWVSGPRWGRSHDHLAGVSAAVSASGRIFAIIDEGSQASVKAPSRWMLVARDAFSGVLLWKREIAPWEDRLRPFRSGPAELPRRLVAVDERVYTIFTPARSWAHARLTRKSTPSDSGTRAAIVTRPPPNTSSTAGPVLSFLAWTRTALMPVTGCGAPVSMASSPAMVWSTHPRTPVPAMSQPS